MEGEGLGGGGGGVGVEARTQRREAGAPLGEENCGGLDCERHLLSCVGLSTIVLLSYFLSLACHLGSMLLMSLFLSLPLLMRRAIFKHKYVTTLEDVF